MAGPALVLFLAFCCTEALAYPAAQGTRSTVSSTIAELLAKASEDLSAGRFEQAASAFSSLLTTDPDSAEALFGLGIAGFQLGRLEVAQKSLERYVEIRPAGAEGHSVLGIVLLAQGKRTAAKEELQTALRLDPDDLEAAKALAQIEVGDYQGGQVVNLIQRFVASPEFDDDARLLLATGYGLAGEHQKALDLLGSRLEQQPAPPPEAFVLAASSAMQVNDGPRAARACILGLRAHLNSDEVEQRCLEVGRKGHLDSFVSKLETSLGHKSEEVPDLILLGRLLTDAGAQTGGGPGRKRALQMLRKAVSLAPSDPAALYNLGRCLRIGDELQEAIGVFQQALEARPGDELCTLIYTQLGLAYRVQKEEAKAEEAFRRALEHNRKAPRYLPGPHMEFYDFLQTVARRQQDAEAVLDELLKRCPGFLPARLQHARSLAKSDRFEDAARQAELVASHADPANQPLLRSAHVFLYQLYTRHGKRQEAERHRAWLKEQ